MHPPESSVEIAEVAQPSPSRGPITTPDFSRPTRPIAEFVRHPDFPRSALGEHVDIGGSAGVVVEIVNQSIKLRSVQGTTQSFNSNRLVILYSPKLDPEVVSKPAESPKLSKLDEPTRKVSQAPPAPEVIENPNFDVPITFISKLVSRPDFPMCALGAHVEIGGYVGVVVEIVKQNSLRVRAKLGTSRNFNADGLRKVYGKA